MLQIFAAVGLTGYLSLRNGRKSINELAHQFQTEASARGDLHLNSYLTLPHKINRMSLDAIARGLVNVHDVEQAGQQLRIQNQLTPFQPINPSTGVKFKRGISGFNRLQVGIRNCCFDQPLLHTMYVDKKLSGVRAVQTPSRLNRTCPDKEETFVLDFANEEQDIINAFQLYYEQTTLAATTNPNRLYDLKNQIDSFQIVWANEFTRVFFKPTQRTSNRDHARLNALIDPSCDRFNDLSEEQQDNFKNTLGAFIRFYTFSTQIMPFADAELEKLYAFVRLLQTKLPKRLQSEVFKLTDEVGLEYYRLQKIREGEIVLQKDSDSALSPSTKSGIPKEKETQAKLSEIIHVPNKRFNTDFTDADKYFFSQIEEELIQNEALSQQAKSNSIQNFKYGF